EPPRVDQHNRIRAVGSVSAIEQRLDTMHPTLSDVLPHFRTSSFLPRRQNARATGPARATERAPPESIGVLERQTVRNAPRYAENCVGQSARVGRGPAEFTSAGRGGACRPDDTTPERRSGRTIGVLANQQPGRARDAAPR